MANRLIWFFGPSAAGKDTLIHAVSERLDDPLRAYLDLGGEAEVCAQSLINDDRDGLAAVIARRHRPDVPLLLKGQTTDVSIRHLPQDLNDEGTYNQEVVFVWADPSQLARRCAMRAQRFKEAGDLELLHYWALQDEAQCRKELFVYQVPCVRSLELPTVCVSTSGDQPEIGVEPPEW